MNSNTHPTITFEIHVHFYPLAKSVTDPCFSLPSCPIDSTDQTDGYPAARAIITSSIAVASSEYKNAS